MQKLELTRRTYQRQIPLILLSIVSFLMTVAYYLNIPALSDVKSGLSLWTVNITNIVYIYGVTTLLLYHINRVRRPDQRVPFRRSLIFILLFVFFGALGLLLPGGFADPDYSYTYTNLVGAVGIAFGAISALYAFPAVLRLMRRVRTIEGIVFVILSFVYSLRNITSWTASFPVFVDIATWLQLVPVAGAMRGAYIAAAVGLVIICIRAIIGREPGLAEAEEIKV